MFAPNAAGDWVVEGAKVPLLDAEDAGYFLRRYGDCRALAAIGVHTERDRRLIASALNYASYRGPIGWLWPLYAYPYQAHSEPIGHVFRQRVPGGGHRVMRPKKTGDGADTMAPVLGPQTMLQRRWGNPEFLHVITEGEGKVAALDRAGFAVAGCGGVATLHDPGARKAGQGFVFRPAWLRLVEILRTGLDGYEDIEGGVEDVSLVFDADVRTNSQVLEAAQRLAGALRGLSLRVSLAEVPTVNGDPHAGVDDYAAALDALGEDPAPELQRLVQKGGHVSSRVPEDMARNNNDRFTDDHVLRVYVAMLRETMRYVREESRWIRWAGTHWEREWPRCNGRARRVYIDQLCAYYDEIATQVQNDPSASEKATEQAASFARKLRTLQRMRGFPEAAAADSELWVSSAQLDQHPRLGLLNTPTGTLDLESGELRPHDPTDLLTHCTAVPYVADAQSDVWDDLIHQMWPAEEHRLAVHKAVGYMLTTDTSEQGFFCLQGGTGTGKSTFAHSVLNVLGGHAALGEPWLFLQSRSGSANEGFLGGGAGALAARLASRRLIVLEEVPANGARFDDQRLKQFTSGGDLTVRPPFSPSAWDVQVSAKILWLMNDLPSGDSTDASLGRRMRLLRADQAVATPMLGLGAVLKAPEHAQAVLAWAVRGTALWRAQGLGATPADWQRTLNAARTESDPVAAWVAEELELQEPRHEGERLYARQAWDAFCEWCGHGQRHSSRPRFARRLRALGIERSKRVGTADRRDFELTGARWAQPMVAQRDVFSPEQFHA